MKDDIETLLARELRFQMRWIDRLYDEIRQRKEMELAISQRLYLAAECLAAAARRNCLDELAAKIEDFLEAVK